MPGRPASATSSGMAMPVSSSSGPIAGFCAMTLNTGVDRSGKTSRGRSLNHVAPSTLPASTRTSARPARADERRISRSTSPLRTSVLMVGSLAARLLGLRLQQKGAIHHDLVSGLETGEDLHGAAQVASATHRPDLERPLAARHEDAPALREALQRRRRNGEHAGDLLPD